MSHIGLKQRVGLALGGGSALGIAHIGVLQAFEAEGIQVDLLSGTSAGAVAAALYAFGVPTDQMIEVTRRLGWRRISSLAYSKLGVSTNKPLGALLTNLLGDANIEDSNIPLAIIATNIQTGDKVTLRSGSLAEAVRASTCLPGFFSPVELNNKLLVDGGLVENVPYSSLYEMGSTLSVGVNLLAYRRSYRPKNMFDILSLSIDTLSSHRDMHLSTVLDFLIEPDLGNFSLSNFKNPHALVRKGYEAAMQHIPKIKAELIKREKNNNLITKIRDVFGY